MTPTNHEKVSTVGETVERLLYVRALTPPRSSRTFRTTKRTYH